MDASSHGRLALAAAAACLLATCASPRQEAGSGPWDAEADRALPGGSGPGPAAGPDAGGADLAAPDAGAGPGAEDAGGGAPADSGASASASCPEDMVAIPGLAACIDRCEASHLDATSASPGSAPTARSALDVLPWVRVTYAEAGAACAAAGKRLCTREEWTRACAGALGRGFPYGNTYNAQMCATQDHVPAFAQAQPTGALVTCHGGVAGLFDLGGNAAEWIQSEGDGAPAAKGASFATGRAEALCSAERALPGSTADAALGFRCCRALP